MNNYNPKHDLALRQIAYHDWLPGSLTEEQSSQLEMLRPLRATCKACTLCRLGQVEQTHNGKVIEDHHVFSNMRPSRFVVVGQNPGYNECVQDEPLVDHAFNAEIAKHGISRSHFYITNLVKCYTPHRLEESELVACESYIKMELGLLQPSLVVTLSQISFGALCPGKAYLFGGIIQSKFGVSVYPVDDKVKSFSEDVATLCELIKRISGSSSAVQPGESKADESA